MAGVPQAGAHLWAQDDGLYTLFFPLSIPLPCFPIGWVLQVHNLISLRLLIRVLSGVAILLFPRCLGALLVLIWWLSPKSSLNKEHRGRWYQAFRCLFRRFLRHTMTCSPVWSRAGYSCNVCDKIYIYTPIYRVGIPGKIWLEDKWCKLSEIFPELSRRTPKKNYDNGVHEIKNIIQF